MALQTITTTTSQPATITIGELLTKIGDIRVSLKRSIANYDKQKHSFRDIVDTLAVVSGLEEDSDEFDDDEYDFDDPSDEQINDIGRKMAAQIWRDDYDETADVLKATHIEIETMLHTGSNNLQLQLTNFLNDLLLFIKTGGNSKIEELNQALPTVFEYLCYSLIKAVCCSKIILTDDDLNQMQSPILRNYLRQINKSVKHVGGGNDKGRDLLLLKDKSTCYCVVQCKKSKDIEKGQGNNIVLALVGSLILENCKCGIIMSTDQGFTERQKTPDLIKRFAEKEYHIDCLFYHDIKRLLNISPEKTSLLILKIFTKLFKKESPALSSMQQVVDQFIEIHECFDEMEELLKTLKNYDEEKFSSN